MSVPAFKNAKSKVRRRRSHHALKPINIVIDKKTGEPRLPHHAPKSAQKAADLEKTIEKATEKVAKVAKKK